MTKNQKINDYVLKVNQKEENGHQRKIERKKVLKNLYLYIKYRVRKRV